MTEKNRDSGKTLHERAEPMAARRKRRQPEMMSTEDMNKTLHELNLHQIELEMQNDELRQAKSEIEDARARYFELYNMAPVGYCTLSDKGIILEANLTAANLFGATRGEMVGKSFSGYIYKEDQDAYYLHKLSLFEKGEAQCFEIRMKSHGAFFWADINAAVVHRQDGRRICRITMSDISRRKLAEEAALESENKYRELVKYAPAGIYELDFRKKCYISVNDVMCQLSEYTREEFLQSSPFGILDDEGKTILRSRMAQWLSGEEPEPTVDCRIKTKYGNELYASLNMKFTRDENRKPLGATVIAHDVTEREIMEKALKESEQRARALVAELRESDENKNQFIRVLSHELRNPLAVIVASLSLMALDDNKEHISTSREIVKGQVNQLCKLVDDLLDLTRISNNKIKLKKENLNLNELLKKAARDMMPEYGAKGIRLNTKLLKEPILISADPVRIAQSVGNLLKNSLKFTPNNGYVVLSLEQANGEAVVSVKDNGMGIDAKLLEHIFEPFVQADTSLDRTNGSGLGLGLSIVKGIVELHGGSVSASSNGIGKGARFAIRLPVTDHDVQTQVREAEKKTSRRYRILTIEDNIDLADVLNTMFGAMGHEAYASHSGLAGLSEARRLRPDVIFCDIGLPRMNGYDVAKLLKADDTLQGTFLIAMTGYAGEDDIERAIAAGFDRHLAKPVDIEALEKILAEIEG